jgi:DNA gyrase subunit A
MELGTVRPITIEDEMRTSYMDYAMSVIVARALPDVRDGLKPVHRKVLYAMSKLGLASNTRHRKSAGIVGEVLKLYHPHSDSAVYDTLVRMAQDFSLRYPLVDGQGNFGSVDGDGAAAMRYTEARLTAIAEELLRDIDKDTVDFGPNYDGSDEEPLVLPAKVPNLLINGTVGIAVGMATNIPPHNLGEICDGITYLAENPEATVEDLAKIIPGPDFPTGGVILGREGILAAYGTGKGKLTVRAQAYIEEIKGNRYAIIVTQLPYQVNKASLIERIADLVKEERLAGISDLRDESDRRGMRIVIELKRDVQPQKLLNQLFKFTAMQTTFGVNSLALVDGGTVPRVLTLKQMMKAYLDYRQDVIRRRTEHELGKARARAHVLEGLKVALDNLDAVISTIRNSKSADAAKGELMSGHGLTEIQAQAILDMQLRRLAALERRKIEEELRDVLKVIARLEGILSRPEKILAIVKDDLKDLKEKYGDERRTRISDQTGDITAEDLIPNLEVAISVTNRGYIKRLAHDTYRTQRRGGRGVTGMATREADFVEHMLVCSTLDSLLFFTNRGKAYQLKAHEIPDASRTAKGLPLVNLISLEPRERVTTLLSVRSFDTGQHLTTATRNGKIKRTNLSEFAAVRANGLIAMSLEQGDELVTARLCSNEDDVLIFTAQGQGIRFHSDQVRPMGRPAAGVNAVRLEKGDRVVGMELGKDGDEVLLVTSSGHGKRTRIDEFRAQGRGGGGVKAFNLNDRAGQIAVARIVPKGSDVLIASQGGLVTRIHADTISLQGRGAQGVSIMNLKGKDHVSSLAVIEAQMPTPGTNGQSPNGHI